MSKSIKLIKHRQGKFIKTIGQLEIILKRIKGIVRIGSIPGGILARTTSNEGIYMNPIMRFSKNTWIYWVISQPNNKLRIIWASSEEENWNREEALPLTKLFKKYRYVQKDKTV